ncbi:hypothetical protein BX666DRAFT_1972704 [Dichotomocladium elegans]|nr:hypothetical protein BX666DRAFT_1972704 [Dichotomocladium elegans]
MADPALQFRRTTSCFRITLIYTRLRIWGGGWNEWLSQSKGCMGTGMGSRSPILPPPPKRAQPPHSPARPVFTIT